MTGESLYPRDLIERLRAELDRVEEVARAAAVHATGTGEWRVSVGGLVSGPYLMLPAHYAQHLGSRPLEHIAINDPAHVLRTIQAHRKILDRHASAWHVDVMWMCRKCGNAGAPCRDVRDLASTYFPESDGETS